MKNSKKIKMVLIVLLPMIVGCCTISTKAFAGSTDDVLVDDDVLTPELNDNLINSEEDVILDFNSMIEELDESPEKTSDILEDFSENEYNHLNNRIEADKFHSYDDWRNEVLSNYCTTFRLISKL